MSIMLRVHGRALFFSKHVFHGKAFSAYLASYIVFCLSRDFMRSFINFTCEVGGMCPFFAKLKSRVEVIVTCRVLFN